MGSLDEDVKNQLKEINNAMVNMEKFFGNLDEQDYDTLVQNMTALEKAQYDVTISYAWNSLFWMYIRSLGDDPKDHKIKEELDRVKGQMQRLQQIKDKSKRPKVDTGAAERMVRHGINNQKKRKRTANEDENWDNE